MFHDGCFTATKSKPADRSGTLLSQVVKVAVFSGMVFYDLFLIPIVFAGWLFYRGLKTHKNSKTTVTQLVSLLLRVLIAGLSVMGFYWLANDNPLTFFAIERSYWGVAPTTPLGQVAWLYYSSGTGSFIGFNWNVGGS